MSNFQVIAATDMESPQKAEFAGGEIVFYTTRCPEKESINEDCLAYVSLGDQAGVLVVADGMGGEEAGHEASSIAVNSVSTAVQSAAEAPMEIRNAILDGIDRANSEILELGVGAATTIAVAEIQASYARAYHVGDSAITHFGASGLFKAHSMCHSPVGYALETGMLTEEQAMHHPERHIVSNYLGGESMRIEIGPPKNCNVGDTVILSSDGMGDNLMLEEIAEIISESDLSAAISELVSCVQTRMKLPFDTDLPSKPDDLTVLAYRRK